MAARKNKTTDEGEKLVFKVSNKAKKLISVGPIQIPPKGEAEIAVHDLRGQRRIERLYERGLANVELVSGKIFDAPEAEKKAEKKKKAPRTQEDLSTVRGNGFVDPVTVTDKPPEGGGSDDEGGGDPDLLI